MARRRGRTPASDLARQRARREGEQGGIGCEAVALYRGVVMGKGRGDSVPIRGDPVNLRRWKESGRERMEEEEGRREIRSVGVGPRCRERKRKGKASVADREEIRARARRSWA